MPPPGYMPLNRAATSATQQQLQTLAMPTAAKSPDAVNAPPVSPPPTSGHHVASQAMPNSVNTHAASEAPTLEQLVREAHDKGISDLHLGVGETPRFRERGKNYRHELSENR